MTRALVTGAGPVAGAVDPGGPVPAVAREVAEVIAGECGLPFLPEPAGGDPRATALGRTFALLSEIDAGLAGEPHGGRWAIGGQRSGVAGVSQLVRTTRRMLRDDLDVLAEACAGDPSRSFLIRLTGPITFAATVVDRRGRTLLADPVARADIATALTEALLLGVTLAASTVAGRGGIVLLLDESALAGVLTGQARASALTVADPISPERLIALLEPAVRAVAGAAATDKVVLDVGATAGALAVGLAANPGGMLLPVDRAHTVALDALTCALDAGVHVLGTVLTTAADVRDPGLIATRVRRSMRTVGLPDESVPERVWLADDPSVPPALAVVQSLTCLRAAADRLSAIGEPVLAPGG